MTRRRLMGISAMLVLLSLQLAPVLAATPFGQAVADGYEMRVQSGSGPDVPVETVGVLSGTFNLFITPADGIHRVRYFIDPLEQGLRDPRVGGIPHSAIDRPPFALHSGDEASPRGLESGWLLDGPHTIVAAIDLQDGRTVVQSARMLVHNGPPALLFGPDPLALTAVEGETAAGEVRLLTTSQGPVSFTLTSDVGWLTVERTESRSRVSQPSGQYTVRAAASGLKPGTYTATLTAAAEGLKAATKLITLDVVADACSPLPCSSVLIRPPYTLNFRGDHRQLPDNAGVGTGFTYAGPQFTGASSARLLMQMADRGTLRMVAGEGAQTGAGKSLGKQLSVGLDPSQRSLLLGAILLDPPPGSGRHEQAGLWFGAQEELVKIGLVSGREGYRIEYALLSTGLPVRRFVSAPLPGGARMVGVGLRVDPVTGAIAGYYSIDRAPSILLGEISVPPAFFAASAGSPDAGLAAHRYAGIFAAGGDAAAPGDYLFDTFSVIEEGSGTEPPVPPPPATGAPPASWIRSPGVSRRP